jgi:hypothetical protein
MSSDRTDKCNVENLEDGSSSEKVITSLVEKETSASFLPQHTFSYTQNSAWREKVIEWYYQVVDRLAYDRDIVFICLRVFDSFVAQQTTHSETQILKCRKLYQTTAMTCLLIAMKLCGRKNFGVDNLLRMGNGAVKHEDIVKTGKIIMEKVPLRKILPVTPSKFCKAFVQLLSSDDEATRRSVLENSHFFAEMSVFDFNFSNLSPSAIAIASITASIRVECNAHSSFSTEDIETFYSTIHRLTGYKASSPRIQSLAFRLYKKSTCQQAITRSTSSIPLHELPARQNAQGVVSVVSEEDLPSLSRTKSPKRKSQHGLESGQIQTYVTRSNIPRTKGSHTLTCL